MKKIKKIKIKYFYLFWIFLFFSCSNFQKTTEFHFRLQASSQILALNQSSKVSFYFQAQLFKFNKLIKKSEKININSNPDLKFRSLGSGEYKIRVFYYAEFDEKIYSLFYQQSKDIDLDDNSGNNQLDIGQTEGHNQFDDDKDGLNNWFEIRSQFSNNKWLISHPGNEDSDGDGLKDNIDRTPGSAEEDGDKIPENSNDKIISSCRSGQKENCLDNCPGINNLDQKDMDSDGIGDSCDRDLDGDGICNPLVSRLRCQEETKSLFRGINDGDNDNDGVPKLIDCNDKNYLLQIYILDDSGQKNCVANDNDDDNDFYSDDFELLAGTDPRDFKKSPSNMLGSQKGDKTSKYGDNDGDFILNHFDPDDDNDNVIDIKDCEPFNSRASISMKSHSLEGITCTLDDEDWDNDGKKNYEDDYPHNGCASSSAKTLDTSHKLLESCESPVLESHVDEIKNIGQTLPLFNYSSFHEYLVSSDINGVLKLWDATINNNSFGKELLSSSAFGPNPGALAFHPNKKHLVTGTRDGKVYFINIDRKEADFGKVFKELQIFNKGENIHLLALSPNGKMAATWVDGRKLKIWNSDSTSSDFSKNILEVNINYGNIRNLGQLLSQIKFSNDSSKLILIDPYPNVFIFEMDKNSSNFGKRLGHIDTTITSLKNKGSLVAFHFSENLLAIAFADRSIRFFKWDQKGKISQISGNLKGPHIKYIKALSFDPSGKYLVSGGRDSHIIFWELKRDLIINKISGTILKKYYGHSQMVSQLKFDPNGKRFFSAGLDGKLKSWKTKNSISDDLIFLSKVKIHEEGVSCLLIKDNQLITGSLDENLKIWEFGPFQKEFLEKNRQKNILGKIPEEIFTMEISKDKKFLASSGAGSTIFFFDIDSKSKTFSNIKKAIPWHKEAVYDLKLDFSANNLFSAGGDGTIGLWNFNPNSKEFSNKIIQFNAHAAKVIKLLVGKDGKRLFSASYDGTIKIWDQDQLLQGKNILLAKINNVGVNTKDLTSDKNETLLFHGDEQGKLSIYDIDQKSKSYLSLISSFNLTNQRINSLLAYYNKGKQYLFIGADGSLYLYEIINNANLQIKLLLEKKVHFAEINQIKIKEFKLINNKKQKYLITASSDKTLGIWNIRF